MSTAAVVEQALALSNLRNRLMRVASESHQALFTNDVGRATALKRLVAEVDNVTDELQPIAFYDDQSTELLLGLSVAVSHARGGDAMSAGKALVEAFTPFSEVA